MSNTTENILFALTVGIIVAIFLSIAVVGVINNNRIKQLAEQNCIENAQILNTPVFADGHDCIIQTPNGELIEI